MKKYNIQNLTGEEIHRLWIEMEGYERKELFNQLTQYAETKKLDIQVGETKEISENLKLEKTTDGFILITDIHSL